MADHDFDEWFGLTEKSQAQDAFPEFIWYNGRHVPVPANDAGRRGAWSQQLFASEAVGYFNRHTRGRPFCLCLSLSVEKGLSDPTADHQQRVAAVDALVGRTVDRLDQSRQGLNTLLIVLGNDDSAEVDPAIVRWPGRITPGSVCDRSAGPADVLPTLVEAVGALVQATGLGRRVARRRLALRQTPSANSDHVGGERVPRPAQERSTSPLVLVASHDSAAYPGCPP